MIKNKNYQQKINVSGYSYKLGKVNQYVFVAGPPWLGCVKHFHTDLEANLVTISEEFF